MGLRPFHGVTPLLVLLPLLGCGAGAAAPPDIVLIVSDDQGAADLGAYGNDVLRTPALDALAAEGLVFDRAFVVVPICTPSRGVIMTGRYGAGPGVADFVDGPHPSATLVALLADAGYRTGLIGKQGYFPAAHYPFDSVQLTRTRDPTRIGARVRDFMAEDDGRPRFLMVGLRDPHRPFPRPADVEDPVDPARVPVPPTLVDTPTTRAELARYYDAIERLDRSLAAILAALAEEPRDRPQLVLFTSDHGASLPFAKATLYDAGLHVPLIVRWPGVVAPGTRTDALVSFVDLLPTLVDAADGAARVPDSVAGRSFLPLLRGKPFVPRDAVFAGLDAVVTGAAHPSRAVRTQRWKYIENVPGEQPFRSEALTGRAWEELLRVATTDRAAAARVARLERRPARELYDLERDPHELSNLAGTETHADVERQLDERLHAWLRAIGDPLARPADGAGVH